MTAQSICPVVATEAPSNPCKYELIWNPSSGLSRVAENYRQFCAVYFADLLGGDLQRKHARSGTAVGYILGRSRCQNRYVVLLLKNGVRRKIDSVAKRCRYGVVKHYQICPGSLTWSCIHFIYLQPLLLLLIVGQKCDMWCTTHSLCFPSSPLIDFCIHLELCPSSDTVLLMSRLTCSFYLCLLRHHWIKSSLFDCSEKTTKTFHLAVTKKNKGKDTQPDPKMILERLRVCLLSMKKDADELRVRDLLSADTRVDIYQFRYRPIRNRWRRANLRNNARRATATTSGIERCRARRTFKNRKWGITAFSSIYLRNLL